MTSSVQPPVLKPSLGTPSNEWAKEITASIDPSTRETPQNTTSGQPISQSPGVTPGSELPGAFPNRGQGETSTDATNITETIVDTAKYYLPTSVANTVETFLGKPLFSNVRQEDSPNLTYPKGGNNNNSTGTTGSDKEVRASEHDVYHKTSLPSQELRGTLPREHVGGVGSLPGASIERSVALLPDEEAEWSKLDTFAGRNTPGYQTPSNRQPISPYHSPLPRLKPSQSGGTLLAFPKPSPRRPPSLEFPRVLSKLTFLRSRRPRTPPSLMFLRSKQQRTLVRDIPKPSPVVRLPKPDKPLGTSNQVCPYARSLCPSSVLRLLPSRF
jgi:hypothetical protein